MSTETTGKEGRKNKQLWVLGIGVVVGLGLAAAIWGFTPKEAQAETDIPDIPDIPSAVFCFIDGTFQNIGDPLHPLFGTPCADEEPYPTPAYQYPTPSYPTPSHDPKACADGIDNDEDGKTDLEDPGCENTEDDDETDENGGGGNEDPAACADGIDNDEDGKTDLEDTGCENADDDDETDGGQGGEGNGGDGGNGGSSNGDGGSSGSSSGGRGHSFRVSNSDGRVLGASSCPTPYINDYIWRDARVPHDPVEVMKLQMFLNAYESENLEVTGIYDAATLEAVNRFQVKYYEEILVPWVPYGFPNFMEPSGHVYKMTRWWINEMVCNFGSLPPQLP